MSSFLPSDSTSGPRVSPNWELWGIQHCRKTQPPWQPVLWFGTLWNASCLFKPHNTCDGMFGKSFYFIFSTSVETVAASCHSEWCWRRWFSDFKVVEQREKWMLENGQCCCRWHWGKVEKKNPKSNWYIFPFSLNYIKSSSTVPNLPVRVMFWGCVQHRLCKHGTYRCIQRGDLDLFWTDYILQCWTGLSSKLNQLLGS